MSEATARTFSSDFKRFFLRGLVVVLPSVLTLWIVVKAYQFVDNTIAEPINRGVRTAMLNGTRVWEPLREHFSPTDEEVEEVLFRLAPSKRTENARSKIVLDLRGRNVNEWWSQRWYMDLIGIAVAIIAVYIAGRLLGGFFGHRIYRKIENVLTSVPIFKQVYPYVKQIVDFLFSDEKPLKFNRVVAVEYPRKGIWSVGFLTGDSMKCIAAEAGESVTVFVPSSPTPFTGYTFTVPKSEVIEVPITVDEALRFAVSGGVLVPDHQGTPILDDPAVTGLIPLPSDVESRVRGTGRSSEAGSREAPRTRDAG